jgi:hypothetical protein
MYGTAESCFHTPRTTTLGRGESYARYIASADASASQAVGTPEMVTSETLKLMVLLVEDGLVVEHVVDVLDDGHDVDVAAASAAARGWWPCG